MPKFGSFKPKASPRPTEQKEGQPSTRDKPERSGRQARRRHDVERSHRRPEEHHRHHSKDSHPRRERSPEHGGVTNPVKDLDDFEESNVFIVDRVGDPKNLEYGSIHRYSVPNYRRSGYGNVVGIPTSAKIDREASNEKAVILVDVSGPGKKRPPRLLARKHVPTSDRRLRFVHAQNFEADDEGAQRDYIALGPSKKRKRGAGSPELLNDVAGAIDYRSIEGKAKPSERAIDDDLEFASNSSADNSEEDVGLRVRQENALLSKQAKAKSGNLDAWLALAEHQQNLVRPDVDSSVLSSSERRAVADMRLSIFNEAASHIAKGENGRERLLKAIIDEGSIIWDPKKLSAKWSEALSECASSSLLWTQYLDYVQYNRQSFCYETSVHTHIQCLTILRKASDECPPHELPRVGHVQVYVLLHLTRLIKESGYDELATALWQGLLETQFFLPSRLHGASAEERLDAFEEFWDSDAPRIGEDQAQGWSKFDESRPNRTRSPTTYVSPTVDPAAPIASFVEQEVKSHGFPLPSTIDDDAATVDPFRCIMYSDIKAIVEKTCSDLPKQALLQAYLSFAGLPPMPCDQIYGSENSPDGNDNEVSVNFVFETWAGQEFGFKVTTVHSRRETIETLLHDGFETYRAFVNTAMGQESARLVDRTLEMLVLTEPDDDALAEYYVAYKHKAFPLEAMKMAKRLLKARSSSLRLYNAYALIESNSNATKAHGVWSTALTMRHKLDPARKEDAVFLWHSRLMYACREADANQALEALLTIGDSGAYHPLKARREFEEGLDRMLLAQKSSHAAMYADCLAWLSYLSHADGDLSAALQTHSKCAARMLKEHDMLSTELLLQHKAKMIEMHVDHKHAYKPAILKQELAHDLNMFPSNSIFLALHSRLAAHDRLRTLVQEQRAVELAKMSITQWSSLVTQEVRRLEAVASGSTANSVRALFKKALLGTDSAVKHSPFLWLAWLRFEHQLTLSDSSSTSAAGNLKQVFLDGMRHLPWHKAWVLAGMRYLPECNSLSEVEMKQVYKTMVEKGLRMRVDIEDLV